MIKKIILNQLDKRTPIAIFFVAIIFPIVFLFFMFIFHVYLIIEPIFMNNGDSDILDDTY